MICPDCNSEMIKAAIQPEDLSGWFVAWVCECEKETANLHIHAKADWTAEVLY